ncbi:MAG: ATP-dependent Clp protease ATP-binding subunit ClpA, partial [Polyangiaceae bacterium]|nr:ATP-dependent Clp protease ATP-binding subunit ClpA [Polyangiaceae bacterium]
MAGPIIARELQTTLRKAFDTAGAERHEYVTLEHLLLALLDDSKAAKAIEACGGNRKRMRKALLDFLEENVARVPGEGHLEPQQTMAVERVLQRAAIHAISSDMKYIDGANVLVQLFKEEDSHAVYVLQQEGIT